MKPLPRHLHIVGICGVGTSAIAIALHKKGVTVTGSDKGFYPPVSTYLSDAGVTYYAGWHPEKMGSPDCIMTGGSGTSPLNPEIVYAKEHNIPTYSYAEILHDYFIRENSVVVTGTWGKTTISTLLSFIFIKGGYDPSYFTGGLSLSHPTGALTGTDKSDSSGESEWSVVEGDEYQTSISDKKPKFAYYSPTHLLLTSVSWDHADLYPSEKEYFEAFEKLVAEVPKVIVYCNDNSGVKKIMGKVKTKDTCKIITYGKDNKETDKNADYIYGNVTHTKNGLKFSIKFNDQKTGQNETVTIESPMLGRFNVENITGAFAMAHEAGIPAATIASAIHDFGGIKRRLERRYEGDVTVLDCHAPTPEKARAVLESIREVYDKKIIVVYEPNIGGRQRKSIEMYDGAFDKANNVFIPRLTKTKIDLSDTEKKSSPLEGAELAEYILKTNPNVTYIEDDQIFVASVVAAAKKGDVIAFLGSHGFRGMIEEVIMSLEKVTNSR